MFWQCLKCLRWLSSASAQVRPVLSLLVASSPTSLGVWSNHSVRQLLLSTVKPCRIGYYYYYYYYYWKRSGVTPGLANTWPFGHPKLASRAYISAAVTQGEGWTQLELVDALKITLNQSFLWNARNKSIKNYNLLLVTLTVLWHWIYCVA